MGGGLLTHSNDAHKVTRLQEGDLQLPSSSLETRGQAKEDREDNALPASVTYSPSQNLTLWALFKANRGFPDSSFH